MLQKLLRQQRIELYIGGLLPRTPRLLRTLPMPRVVLQIEPRTLVETVVAHLLAFQWNIIQGLWDREQQRGGTQAAATEGLGPDQRRQVNTRFVHKIGDTWELPVEVSHFNLGAVLGLHLAVSFLVRIISHNSLPCCTNSPIILSYPEYYVKCGLAESVTWEQEFPSCIGGRNEIARRMT